MNFLESKEYLYSLGHETLAMKLGLENIAILCEGLENPQLKYRVVHIAGTNGKGSTAAMVESMAQSAGYRTGLYTSPHLVEITERIRVNGRDIAPQDFGRLATVVREVSERLLRQGRLAALPTFFEQVTAISFLHFAEESVELAVLEVGLGGRLDATNICAPVVCAITPISIDHQEYLGQELKSIAREKAGIIKEGIPVIVAGQEPGALSVILEVAKVASAPVVSVDDPENKVRMSASANGMFEFQYRTRRAEYEIKLNLRGEHQVDNARTAIHIAEELRDRGCCMPRTAIEEGLSRIDWAGRLELIKWRGSTLLMDGAHNLAGARTLQSFLRTFEAGIPITMIFGAMSDKAIAGMAEMLFPFASIVIATPIDNIRSAQPVVIADAATQLGRPSISAVSVEQALDEALQRTPSHGLICVCGSLYLIGEVKHALTALA